MANDGQIAVITGASGGIGRAVAAALVSRGFRTCLTGRDGVRLQSVADELATDGARPTIVGADLGRDDDVRAVVAAVEAMGRVDVLVHAAGAIRLGDVMAAGPEDLDEMYRVNFRAPYLLTQALQPLLVASRGQVVFINSTAALRSGADNDLYAATKQALRALAGSLRDRLNPLGVRVLSVFPGRTATRLQEQVHAFEGKSYEPATLLQPNDVADVVIHALTLPRTVEVTDVMLRPMVKPSNTRSSR